MWMWSQAVVLGLLLAVSTSEGFVKMVGTPVIYTNGDGGGSDEIEAPTTGEAIMMFEAQNTVCGAWWVPYDNIPDLSVIHMVNVEPSGTKVRLQVKGTTRTGRVRIQIYAFVCG